MIRRILRTIRRRLGPDHVRLEDAVLPAPHLRFGGPEFRDDAHFLASARAEADRVVRDCGLPDGGRLLEIGPGPGRLAIGLLDRAVPLAEYRGLDAHRPSVRWCARHLAPRHDGFRFEHVDVRTARYNPGGAVGDASARLPLPQGQYHVVYLYSVFSHMMPDGVRGYLREIRRVLAPGGTLFFTGFVEEGVPEVEENPSGYRQAWSGPLHCVRYERGFLERMLAENGFRIDRFVHGVETDGQSAVYAVAADA